MWGRLLLKALIPFSAQCTSMQSFVVPSFVNTFVWFCTRPVLLLLWTLLLSTSAFSASSTFFVPVELLSTNMLTTPLPVLHQPFVVGPGFSPGPTKIMSQIVSGKFVKLSNLLQANIAQSATEPQLFFDGQMVLTSTSKWSRKKKWYVTWTEAFSPRISPTAGKTCHNISF